MLNNAIDKLQRAMLGHDVPPPPKITIGGPHLKIQRWGHKKIYWLTIQHDTTNQSLFGAYGNWKEGTKYTFKYKLNAEQPINQEPQSMYTHTIHSLWDNCTLAAPTHPYLSKKGIQPHNTRVTGDGRLVVPLYNNQGELSSLQYISADSEKRYLKGQPTKGCYNIIGNADPSSTLYIAEGFATAATIHEVTGKPCIAAFSASNLVPVAEAFSSYNNVIIVADNDKNGIGQKYADQAASKYGCEVIMPPMEGDANDYHLAGESLLDLLTPVNQPWLISLDEFCNVPTPIEYLIDGWIPVESLVMVHGPSGSGKTFLLIDWSMRVALSKGTVVYLAGEGHQGMKGRLQAWRQVNNVESAPFYISASACDLNTMEGTQKVISSLKSIPDKPVMVVVDTLHRFLDGDENSAKDTKTMLDSCSKLMQLFKCTVVLVHHTGVAGEAQHRARGSSAWKGALESEISVVPPGDDDIIEVRQYKNKDGERSAPIHFSLEPVTIKGWFDSLARPVVSAILQPSEAPVSVKSSPDGTGAVPSKITKGRLGGNKIIAGLGGEQRNTGLGGNKIIAGLAGKDDTGLVDNKINIQLEGNELVVDSGDDCNELGTELEQKDNESEHELGHELESDSAQLSPEFKKALRFFERAYWHGGEKKLDGKPLIERAAIKELLINDGLAPATIRNQLKPSRSNGIIKPLMDANAIITTDEGWIITVKTGWRGLA